MENRARSVWGSANHLSECVWKANLCLHQVDVAKHQIKFLFKLWTVQTFVAQEYVIKWCVVVTIDGCSVVRYVSIGISPAFLGCFVWIDMFSCGLSFPVVFGSVVVVVGTPWTQCGLENLERLLSEAAGCVGQRGLELGKRLRDLRFADTRDLSMGIILESYREWMASVDSIDMSEPGAKAFETNLPAILNLSLNCPHQSIRESSGQLLKEIEAWGHVTVPAPLVNGCSNFIPESEVPHFPLRYFRVTCVFVCYDSLKLWLSYFQVPPIDNAVVLEDLQEAFDCDGRVSHMTRLLAYHPNFLRVWYVVWLAYTVICVVNVVLTHRPFVARWLRCFGMRGHCLLLIGTWLPSWYISNLLFCPRGFTVYYFFISLFLTF